MSHELLTLNEVAERLKVSRRRVEAMVQSKQLAADRLGWQWAVSVEGLRAVENNMLRSAGRPLSELTSWRIIGEGLGKHEKFDRDDLDLLRRRLRTRARHVGYYVHPGLLKRIEGDFRGVLGGRSAASDAGAPVELSDSIDVYIREDERPRFVKDFAARPTFVGANLFLHVVENEVWPFESDCHFVDGFVAWLDLADREDRAADTLLDRLVGGRLYA
jgi:excisionase family DNA binding protein